MRIIVNQVLQVDIGGIRMIELLSYFPQVLLHCRFRKLHHVPDIGSHRSQDNPGADPHFFLHGSLDPFVLRYGDYLHQHSGQHHDSQSGQHSLFSSIHSSITEC